MQSEKKLYIVWFLVQKSVGNVTQHVSRRYSPGYHATVKRCKVSNDPIMVKSWSGIQYNF